MPGYLKIANLSSEEEIRTGAVVAPVLLGFLVLLLGRFGLSNAPRSSYAKGMATAAALVTLGAVLGLVCYGVPTAMIVIEGLIPDSLMKMAEGRVPDSDSMLPTTDPSGVLQRAGLFAMSILFPIAELYYVVALGRMGAGLHNDRLAGRVTRYMVYVGLIFILLAAWSFAVAMFPADVHKFLSEEVQPQWDKLGENKATVAYGLAGFAGLVLWFWNVRLVTGARRAIREWLEQNEPGA